MSKKFRFGALLVTKRRALLGSLLFLGLVFLPLSTVSAETGRSASSSSKIDKKLTQANTKDRAASKAADKLDRAGSRAAEMREKFSENIAERINHIGTIMLDRMQAAVNRLNNILARIESRITKIEAKNKKDTAPLKTKVSKVKAQLQATQATLDQARAELEALDTADTPKEAINQLKDLTSKVRDSLKQAHKDMVDLVIAIAKLEPKSATPSATPTATSSAEEE